MDMEEVGGAKKYIESDVPEKRHVSLARASGSIAVSSIHLPYH